MALMSNDFFSRWSKRKLEEAAPPSESNEAEAALPATVDPGSPVPPDEPEPEDAIAPEELAALPDPDDLTVGSDITGFLRQGVPLALRNRALRRMWSLDPAIRDYIGDARDYAWDWNTPGGMPVSGPLSASTDVGKMLRGLYEPAPEAPVCEVESLPEREELIEPAPDRGAGETLTAFSQSDGPESTAETPDDGEKLLLVRVTRHGGALPS